MRRRGLWTAAMVGGVILVAAVVVNSARNATVPTGPPGGMGGMAMPSDDAPSHVDIAVRDIDGRRLHLPDGRPGAVLLIRARGCAPCVAEGRRLVAARRRAGGRSNLTVVSVGAGDTRASLRQFARAVGNPAARYVLDDPRGKVARSLRATGPGSILVYNRAGHVVQAHDRSVRHLTMALRTAGA